MPDCSCSPDRLFYFQYIFQTRFASYQNIQKNYPLHQLTFVRAEYREVYVLHLKRVVAQLFMQEKKVMPDSQSHLENSTVFPNREFIFLKPEILFEADDRDRNDQGENRVYEN